MLERIFLVFRVLPKDPRLLLLAMRDADLLDVLCSGVFVAVLRLPRDRHRGIQFTYLLSQPMAALRSVCLSSSWVCFACHDIAIALRYLYSLCTGLP